MLLNFFQRNSGKSRIPPKLKHLEYPILNAVNSFRVQLCLKVVLFSHFSAGLDITKTFYNFSILEKSIFLPKKFYNINHRSKKTEIGYYPLPTGCHLFLSSFSVVLIICPDRYLCIPLMENIFHCRDSYPRWLALMKVLWQKSALGFSHKRFLFFVENLKNRNLLSRV